MRLEFKPSRWNCRKYQVERVGDGFYHFLIFGIPYNKGVPFRPGETALQYSNRQHQACIESGLYRTKEDAIDAAQRLEDQETAQKLVDTAEAL